MINLGELNDRISIASLMNVIDEDTGIDKETIVIKYKLRGKVKTISSKEFYENSSETKEITKKFIIRKRNFDEDDFIIFKDKKYNIEHIHELNKSFVEITAILRV